MPWRSHSAIADSHMPTWAGAVATQSQPPRRKCASMPCSAQNASMLSTASSDARAIRTPSSSPHALMSVPSFDHQVVRKPPFRPLAPPPQMSASTMATSHPGSSSLMSKRRPEPGIAAADDAHIGLLAAGERSGRPAVLDGQRLLEPERAVHGGGFSHSGRFERCGNVQRS